MATPLNKPIVKFNTPNVRDIYFVEFVDVRGPYYSQFEYGDPYPDQITYPGAVLTYRTPIETGGGEDQRARMVWCSAPSAQDVYNARVSFTEQNASYPLYSRTYLQRRTNPFVPATRQVGLASLVDLVWISGGKNYTGDSFNHIDLIFTGGGGTGALGFGVVQNGVIVSAFLLNGGTGFTSAPTISALGGSGVNITAILQSTGALLISEEKKPADGELGTIWDSVVRIYETLPGPVVRFDEGYEKESGRQWRRYRQRVQQGSSIPAQNDEYPAASGFFVVDAGVHKDPGQSNAGTLEIYVLDDSSQASLVEYRKGNYPVPDNLVLLVPYTAWLSPPNAGAKNGPYQNRTDHKDYADNLLPNDIAHRGTYDLLVSIPAGPPKDTITYYIPGGANDPGAIPAVYGLTSQPSEFLPIGRNTIHGPITVYFDFGGAGELVEENIRSSNPDTYVSGNHVIDAEDVKWEGGFRKRIVTTVPFPVIANE